MEIISLILFKLLTSPHELKSDGYFLRNFAINRIVYCFTCAIYVRQNFSSVLKYLVMLKVAKVVRPPKMDQKVLKVKFPKRSDPIFVFKFLISFSFNNCVARFKKDINIVCYILQRMSKTRLYFYQFYSSILFLFFAMKMDFLVVKYTIFQLFFVILECL